jgi:hypothetical protein
MGGFRLGKGYGLNKGGLRSDSGVFKSFPKVISRSAFFL